MWLKTNRVGIFLAFVLMLAAPRLALGDPMPAERARAAVRGWLRADRAPLRATLGQTVKRVETFSNTQGTALYHVVYLNPEGFVIVAADDLVEPVVAFAPSGKFDPSTNNPLGALVGRDLPRRIAKVRGVAPAMRAQGVRLTAKGKWGRLHTLDRAAAADSKSGLPGVSDVRVEPLVQTKWSQSTAGNNACYNYYTPPGAAGAAANYLSGCVATALAQLMKFWQHPTAGVGTAAFWITVDGTTQNRNLRGGDGAGGPYVWSAMVADPTSSTLAQRQAIGALCADAGVAVHMDYTADASGAYTIDAKNALVRVFGYANAVMGGNGGENIGAGLNSMVNPNLDAGFPVMFGIAGPAGGHEIVGDGYGYNLATLYHHLNMGWGGSETAWYNLPDIDSDGAPFDTVDECIYNIYPSGTGEIISGRVTDGAGTPLAGVTLTATRTGGGTYTATSNAKGIYALAKIPASSQYTINASQAGYTFIAQSISTGRSTDYARGSGNQWAINFTAGGSSAGVTVTVIANPAEGGTVSGGGTYTVGSAQQISASAAEGWTFTGWSDGSTANPRTISVPAANITYTANFVSHPTPTAQITVAASPANGGSVRGGGVYAVGASVQLAASAVSGWTFLNWNDGHTYAFRSVTVPEAGASYTAYFAQFAAVQVAANAGGTAAGGGSFRVGSNVVITATAAANWIFTSWNDGNTNNPRTITVPLSGASYTASFVPAATITVQPGAAEQGIVTGGGIFAVGSQQQLAATPNMGWRFVGWSDGDTNRIRFFTVGSVDTNLTANFAMAPMSVLLQAGDGGQATLWTLGTSYRAPSLTTVTGAMGGGWVLRAMNQNRILLQQGSGGSIHLWELTNGIPSRVWVVSGALPGWIARDLDGNRVLLQKGDGGMVGIWTLNTNNVPAAWATVTNSAPGLVARALRGNRLLVQAGTGTTMGYWTLNSANVITAWTPLASTLPAGWIPRAMTPDYMLLQAGDGGASGIWDLDLNGQPLAFHTLSAAMPGWIARGMDMDEALPATLTVGSNTNLGGTVTGAGAFFPWTSAALTATASNGWVFTSWSDGVTNSTRMVVVPAGGATYTANFVPLVTVNVVASPANGGGTGGSGTYIAGSTAAISASASNGWVFTGWGDSVTNNPRAVVVSSGSPTYTANFTAGVTLGLQSSPASSGTLTGGGTYLAGTQVAVSAQPLVGWKFVSWNDGDTNQTRQITLGAVNTNLTASFAAAALQVLLQAGDGGMAGLWTLGTNYLPATWATVTGPLGGKWALRALDKDRILLQAGTGGMIGIWALNSSGVPTNWWTVSVSVPGWIARDLDGNRVLLQQGDGGAVGIWKLGPSNTPTNWIALPPPMSPGLVARALCGNRVLLQSGTSASYWTLNDSGLGTALVPISTAVPSGWILRSMTPNYMLLQAGTGGMIGVWDLDANGQPTVWHTISGPLPGWIARSLDQP